MKKNTIAAKMLFTFFILLMNGIWVTASQADSGTSLSAGQTVYVPIYSHIYSGLKGNPFILAATLSIRNTDPGHPITLVSVKFYDSDGKLVKEYLEKSAELKAMASTRYILTESDTGGGSGANFLVKWKSQTRVNPPLIEAVMIGTRSGQGISFVSRGQVLKDENNQNLISKIIDHGFSLFGLPVEPVEINKMSDFIFFRANGQQAQPLSDEHFKEVCKAAIEYQMHSGDRFRNIFRRIASDPD